MHSSLPRLQTPALACDSNIHIYDTAMPVAPTANGPGPAWATVTAYRAVQVRLGTSRVVVTQPTAYGTDNTCTVAAIAALGLATTRGVAVVDASVNDAELHRLHEAGIRGVRFQMLPGGALPWEMLEPVAARIAGLGWHIQLQMDGRLLPDREALISHLPCAVMIDHIGKFIEPVPVDHPGVKCLQRLLDRGNIWLKLAGPYEVSKSGPPHYADVGLLAKLAVRTHPERLVWASNWPHVAATVPPDDVTLLDLLLEWAPDAATQRQILTDNPAVLYGF